MNIKDYTQNSNFRKELTSLINKYSMENASDTPDFILTDYLMNCLVAFNNATNERDEWYGDSVNDNDDVPF